jgi:hypothetical protein
MDLHVSHTLGYSMLVSGRGECVLTNPRFELGENREVETVQVLLNEDDYMLVILFHLG